MLTLEKISSSEIFYRPTYTSEGNLEQISIFQTFFASSRSSDPKKLAFHALRHLGTLSKNDLEKETQKIVKFAKNTGLLAQNVAEKFQTTDEVIQKIASHLLPNLKHPTLENLIENYHKNLVNLNLLKSSEFAPISKKPVIEKPSQTTTQQPSWNFTVIAAIGLIAIGALAYIAYENIPKDLPMDPVTDEPINFREILSPICEKSVRNFCTEDGSKCLKDYLNPTWEAKAFTSTNDVYPLCRVEIVAKDCESVVSQSKVSPDLFLSNFERIPAFLTKEESRNPIVKWARTMLPMWKGDKAKEILFFKAHIDCTTG